GVLALLDREPPAVLVLSQSHWRDGRLLDLDRIAMAAREQGVPLVLDLSQSLGVLACDVARWQPAFAMSVGYKWLLGLKGLCYLWAAPDWCKRIAPFEQHWQGRAPTKPWAFGGESPPTYREGARRFDGGEVTDPLRLATAEAGLAQIIAWTPDAIAAQLGMLLDRLKVTLAKAGRDDECVDPSSPHLLGFAPTPERLARVRSALHDAGIICIERDGVFRLAPHLHIDEAAIDCVSAAILSTD
ncbi:aminotransferase class V-fold PLP-dependent enzyme, partial [Cognatilysobacter lacus]